MHFDGTFTTKASQDVVWDFFLSPEKLSKCLPDVQELKVHSPDSFETKVKAGVGFVKGQFNFKFNVTEKKPKTHARLVGHGSGTGSVIDLDTSIDLSTSGSGTTMKWSAEAKVGGLVASVGQRLINSAAEKTIKELFGCIQKTLEK